SDASVPREAAPRDTFAALSSPRVERSRGLGSVAMDAAAIATDVARRGILTAADSRRVQRLVRAHGMRFGAGRFVAGETLDDCVGVLRRLNEQGLYANTTLLGEGVLEPTQTERVVAAYEEVLRRIAENELRANVALKLTHLGLEIDEGLAVENMERLLAHGQFIRIDMEQSQFVEATLRVYRR